MRIKGCRDNADIWKATLNLCDALWCSDDTSNDHRCRSALHTSRHNLGNAPTGREHRVQDDYKCPGDIADTVHIPMRFRRGFITRKPSEHQLSIRTQLLHSTGKRETSTKDGNDDKASHETAAIRFTNGRCNPDRIDGHCAQALSEYHQSHTLRLLAKGCCTRILSPKYRQGDITYRMFHLMQHDQVYPIPLVDCGDEQA
jgi:hypothetical protein